MPSHDASRPLSLSRRRFVTGLAAGGVLAGLGVRPSGAGEPPGGARGGPAVLGGTRFDLAYRPIRVSFTGQERLATAINGSVPAPVLRWREGDTVTLNVSNHLAEDASIHWHGIILPAPMDGVPGISFPGIKPGETFTYRFRVAQSGTYWYHSHSGFHEQTGAYGAIVIEPRAPEPFRYDRDHVIVLSDWTDEDPHDVFATLKKASHYYNFRERTLGEQLAELGEKGLRGYLGERAMWNRMRMSDRDFSDVTGYTYTFLMNGVPPAAGWTGLFRRGERVRLRFINAAAMTFFDVRIPGLEMTVVAADGQNIHPVTVDEFRMGVAETFDVLVEPKADRAYTVFAQAIDRTGYARGTLTPDPSWTADVPAMDPAPVLTHADMGMGGMAHAGHAGGYAGQGAMHADQRGGEAAGQGHQAAGHAAHGMHGDGGHAAHGTPRMPAARPAMGSGPAGYGSTRPVVHAPSERGPQVDMRADAPRYRLDDPGVGLRGNGRRVLVYADLRRLAPTYDPREPGREIDLHLTGNMSRYMWSVNGVRFADAEPIALAFGERVRINLVNDTMMNHPIHLHGMWSDLETGDGEHIPRKHTVVVQPGARLSYLVTADAMGPWAYHCHLLYHMPGMFRKVVVS